MSSSLRSQVGHELVASKARRIELRGKMRKLHGFPDVSFIRLGCQGK
jgi:hypothetical protein